MPTPSFNIVTFLPIGGSEVIYLTLNGDWSVRGGMEADVNTAIIPYTERSKLPENLIYISGTIMFWGTQDPRGTGPATPDHALGNIWLVDCQPDHIGREPGDANDKIMSYKLAFADHRNGFKSPRGGRLTQGLGNPDPLGDATLRSNTQLVNACLTAMGISAGSTGGLDAVDPPRQLEWFGAHAPSELAKLLQHTGHVYCPYSGGGASIQTLGAGIQPVLPAGRVSHDVTASIVGRLPRYAVFTSCPNAVARTYDDQASGGNVPAWEFVCQDPANDYKWAEISTITGLSSTPEKDLAKGLPDVADQDRKMISEQLFKVIRLKDDRFDRLQCPILKDVLYQDGRTDQPHIIAIVAVQNKDQAWTNLKARINAHTVDGVGNLLAFDARLGGVTNSSGSVAEHSLRSDRDSFFKPLDVSDLKPAFTVEDWNSDQSKKLYSTFGFVIGAGVVGAMSDNEAAGLMTGYRPDVGIYDMPELRCIYYNDGDNNRDELAGNAHGMAQALLIEALPARTIEVTGFFPSEIDGRINEIHYSQSELKTTIIRDCWTSPGGGKHHRSANSGGGGTASTGIENDDLVRQSFRSHPSARDRALGQQIQRGGAIATSPRAPASHAPPERTGSRRIMAKATSLQSGMYCRYKGKTVSFKCTTDASGDVDPTEFGDPADQEDCVIVSFVPLPLSVPIVCDAGPANDDGNLILFADAAGRTFDVSISSNASGGGKYIAQLLQPAVTNVSESGNLTAANFGTAYTPSTFYTRVLALNASEIGMTTHALDAGRVCKATFLNVQDTTLLVSIDAVSFFDCTTTS